jgi:predicted O-methyltransferase YrrM
MVKYNLEHLTQPENQNVSGPIQDDEALFLYSIIRGCRLYRILEIGGLNGYSATNFLKAISFSNNGIVYTCDINPVPKLADNHHLLIKNALDITLDDLDHKPLDLVFFDCHHMVQYECYLRWYQLGIINDNTIIALHDTNLHYSPYHHGGKYIPEDNGYVHQSVERYMVNLFKNMGYDIFSISTDASKHSPDFPVRHGLTVCKKFKFLQY